MIEGKGLDRSLYADLATGLWNSRILKAAAATAAVGIGAALFLHPATWILVAMTVSVFVLALWIFKPVSPLQLFKEATFEISAIWRLTKPQCFDRIEGTDLYLGSMPNRLHSDVERMKEEGIEAVFSINEPWERLPLGLSLPYQPEDWEALGMVYKTVDQKDYKVLNPQTLHETADWIDAQIKQGRKILVHCRAGKGRSAMAIAAYLIKHKKMDPLQAQQLIKHSRPHSTIHKSKYKKALSAFQNQN